MRKMNPLGRSSGALGCACRGLRLVPAAAALALGGMPVWLYAGSFVTDFNSGLPPGSAVFGDSVVSANDGQGGGYTNSGCLQLTGGSAGTNGAFIIDNDLDGGTPVVSFTAAFKVLLAGGSNAKGFSFNFAPNLPMGPISVDGAGSGLTVEFDTLLGSPLDTAPAVDVKIGGVEQDGIPFEGLRAGVWVDVVIQLNPNNTLDVVYDGTYVYSNLDLTALGYVPATGSLFGFGATAGETADNQFIDDLNIITSVSPAPYVQSYAPRGRQAQTNSAIDIVLTDNLTQVNPASVVLTLDGAVAASAVTRKGNDTQVHFAPPAPFTYSSLHSVILAFSDNATPAPQQFTWSYTFGVAGAPFVPGSYVALFTEGFESYALGALDKNPLYLGLRKRPQLCPERLGQSLVRPNAPQRPGHERGQRCPAP